MPPNINGVGAVINPELGFVVPVAAAIPSVAEVFVATPDFPVVVAVGAAVAAAGRPRQYSSKY